MYYSLRFSIKILDEITVRITNAVELVEYTV